MAGLGGAWGSPWLSQGETEESPGDGVGGAGSHVAPHRCAPDGGVSVLRLRSARP